MGDVIQVSKIKSDMGKVNRGNNYSFLMRITMTLIIFFYMEV